MRSEGSSRLRRISRRKLHMRVATVKRRDLLTYRSIPGSVARAHLSTAALMATEPHIRSPFSERLAPQSLILEVIGLGRGVHTVFRHIAATVCDGPPARIQRG